MAVHLVLTTFHYSLSHLVSLTSNEAAHEFTCPVGIESENVSPSGLPYSWSRV